MRIRQTQGPSMHKIKSEPLLLNRVSRGYLKQYVVEMVFEELCQSQHIGSQKKSQTMDRLEKSVP